MLASVLLHNHPEPAASLILSPLGISSHPYFMYPLKTTIYLLQQKLEVSKMDLSAQSVLFLYNFFAFHVVVLIPKLLLDSLQSELRSKNSAYRELKLNRLWPDGNQALSQKVIIDRHQMAD